MVDPGTPPVVDQIYPEWPNVRFAVGGSMSLCTGPGALEDCTPAGGIGPTSHATHFRLGTGCFWSVGLTPLGWARFIDADASDYAERWEPISESSVFAPFAPVLDVVQEQDPDAVVEGINAHVGNLLHRPGRDEDKILRAHTAMVDPSVTTVSELADAAGILSNDCRQQRSASRPSF